MVVIEEQLLPNSNRSCLCFAHVAAAIDIPTSSYKAILRTTSDCVSVSEIRDVSVIQCVSPSGPNCTGDSFGSSVHFRTGII